MRGEEVKEKIKQAGFTLRDVAEKMGVSPQALQNTLKTEDIKTGVLKTIASAINKNVYFFLEDILEEGKNADKHSDFTTAPLITQYAHGSYLKGYADLEYMEAQPLYVASKKYSGGNYVAFEIRGDSMDDDSKRSICSGDVVLGRELYKQYWSCKLHVPRVFIIVHRTEGIILKEIVSHDVEAGVITCHSFNPEYDDFEITLSNVAQLFYIKEVKRETENGY